MTNVDDPKVVLRDLVSTKWNSSNTLSTTPDFRTGWRDEDLPAPQLTFGPDNETPLTDTGFDGIDPTGGGPTATIRGTCQIHAWASRDVTDENPKQLVDRFKTETKRIITDNTQISTVTGITTGSNYDYIAYSGNQFMPEPPEDPDSVTVFRYLINVRYEYTNRR